MRRRRATLPGMDLAELDRILARVCDIIDQTAGDWDATRAALEREFPGEEEFENALAYAIGYLIAYAEPGGPAFIRGMRDRRRRLIPAQPAGAPGRGFLRRRPA
jgi:hypothetical protein